MKILAINGSPRKKDTYEGLQRLEKILKSYGKIEMEYIHLSEWDITACHGCHGCILKEGFLCPQTPRLKELLEKLTECDGLILASPVYTNSVTALLKGLFDHLAFLWHRPRYIGKKAMLLVTGGGTFGDILKYMKLNVGRWGFETVSTAGIPHLEALNEKYKERTLKKLERSAEKFYQAVEKNELREPSFNDLMWFHIWRGNCTTFKKSLPEDFAYWEKRGWTKMDYFYPVKLSLWKKALITVFDWMGAFFIKRIYKV